MDVPEGSGRLWRLLAYLYAVILTAGTAYFLVHVPFEVGDNVADLLQHQNTPPLITGGITSLPASAGAVQGGFLRPVSWATTKVIFDLSAGQPYAVFRTLHVVMVLGILVLLTRLVRVSSALTCGLAALSAGALLGIHPFHEAVRETALNIKLLIPLCCFAAVSLSASKPHWWKDVAAVALVAYAIFSNELGILVWVCFVAAYLVGFRGVSRGSVLALTAVLGAYFYLRFFQWNVGTPNVMERSSGFGLRTLDPPELMRRFGENPFPFYVYNVVAAVLGVLFSEPRSGAFLFTRQVLEGEVTAGMIVTVLSSACATLLMAWYAVSRARAWVKREFTYNDGLFLIFAAVLAANAAISFPYIKDVTLSTAGTFYALGMFVALHALVVRCAARPVRAWRGVLIYTLLIVIAVGWSMRAASFYIDLQRAAYKAKSDWVDVYGFLRSQGVSLDSDQDAQLVELLRTQALALPVPRVPQGPAWFPLAEIDPFH